jgi:hypothetical protein
MYNNRFSGGRDEYYYREEYNRPEVRNVQQKPYGYTGPYYPEREQFEYEQRRPVSHTVSHIEPARYYESREYRSQPPPSQPYPSERTIPTYQPTERVSSTRLSYHPPPAPEYPEGYERRAGSMQTDKAVFGTGSVYAPSRASSRVNVAHYPEQQREAFSRRRQPSYESLRSVPSPYIPPQTQAPPRQYNGSEYSEAQRPVPPARNYTEQPRLSHRASFVEEQRQYEPQLHRKTSAYLDQETRSRTNGEDYTPPSAYTTQRSAFKTRSYLNLQSDAVSTSSTKARRESDESAPQDKQALPKTLRQTSDKMETLIRNTSKLSTADEKGIFLFNADEKPQQDNLQQLFSITKTIGNQILEKKDAWSQQEWGQLCENIAAQLKYIDAMEQNKK